MLDRFTWFKQSAYVWKDEALTVYIDPWEVTVEDPGVFTMPWSAGITYRRPLGDWPEMVCAETTHGHFSREHHAVPTASKSDF